MFGKKNTQKTEAKCKIVYRFISERERLAIERKDMLGIGGFWAKGDNRSSHRYKTGERYIHFFDDKKCASDVFNALKGTKKYFCEYSVPISVLKKHVGRGYYPPHGYDNLFAQIKEYAIPIGEYDEEWLVSIVGVEEFFDVEEQ